LTAATLLLGAILGGLVSIDVVVDGEHAAGRQVTARSEHASATVTTDAAGHAVLKVPADLEMVLFIDGRDAGVVRTPPAGYRADVSIRWPPMFVVRFDKVLPSVAAGLERTAGAPIPGARFRVVPIDERAGAAIATRDVSLDSNGAILVDWLLPDERFDLYVPAPSGGRDEWIWNAGPFLVEANAEETILYTPPERITLRSVEFAAGSGGLDATSVESQRVLGVLASQLRSYLSAHPEVVLAVEGHTDNVGAPESNQELSQRRAGAVRGYLVERGIESARIAATGRGESVPVASNDDERGRAQNRRVEIRLDLAPATPAAPAPH
jgi:outer membrane protein OmpA-like peptidoglycan-associated protein